MRKHGGILRAVRTPDEEASLGFRLVLAGFAAFPVALALTAPFPTGARPAIFIAGLVAAGAICGAGGVLARRALTRGTSKTARTVATGIVGLMFAAIAGVTLVTALVGAFF
jgi:hypothetical protein